MVPLANLRFMQQKPSGAKRVFIKDIPLLVWADVHVVNKSLSILNLDVAFLQAALTHAQAFYLCPCQRNACLYGFFNEIIMICLFVLRNQLCSFSFCHTESPPRQSSIAEITISYSIKKIK